MTDWERFVVQAGFGARVDHLAVILGQPADAIRRLRTRVRVGGAAVGSARRAAAFADLFVRWHGRPPRDDEWSPPRRAGGHGYEWQPPELALLLRLTGRLGVHQISRILTTRLRQRTGDPRAVRRAVSVQVRINHSGLQTSDVLGGLLVREAAQEIGSVALVHGAIYAGRLRTFRVGRLHVIPRAVWAAFVAGRDRPPVGWVRLCATLRGPLGIRSDSKLPEYAKLGYIPDVRFVRSERTWYIAPDRARTIITDVREGRPLPWHGKPLPGNLKRTGRCWQRRRRAHRRCRVCRRAWRAPAPRSFADFCRRYPAIDLGLKRHMTSRLGRRHQGPRRPWGSIRAHRGRGVTIAAAARLLERTVAWVRGQIARGVARPVRSIDRGAALRIPAGAMAKLRKARGDELRGRPPGVWLGVHAAAARAGVSCTTIERWRRRRLLSSKRGARGRLYSLTTVERQTRAYWATSRFKRAPRPAWLRAEAA